jgi:hypothetical protein
MFVEGWDVGVEIHGDAGKLLEGFTDEGGRIAELSHVFEHVAVVGGIEDSS